MDARGVHRDVREVVAVSGMGLYQELETKTRLLDQAVRELRGRGTALAQAERDYKVAAAKKIVELRDRGYPVTVIPDLMRGDEEVSLLRFKRDCAETLWKSALEYIQVTKLQIRIIEAQIEREWGQAGTA